MRDFDCNYQDIKIGSKFVYIGEQRDDEELYEWMKENSFVGYVEQMETESELIWTDKCPFAIQMALCLVEE